MSNTAFNPSDKSSQLTLASSNLNVTFSGSGDSGVRAVDAHKSGKYYFEIDATSLVGGDSGLGIGTASAVLAGAGNTTLLVALVFPTGNIWINGTNTGVSIGTLSSGSPVVCFCIDLDNEEFWARKGAAGNWNNSGTANPATNTGGLSLGGFLTTGTTNVYPMVTANSTSFNVTANFGDTSFTGTVPSGFTSGWPAAAPTESGTIAQTLGLVTQLLNGAINIGGHWASTEAADTFAATGTGSPGINVALSTVEIPDIFAAVGYTFVGGPWISIDTPDVFSGYITFPQTGVWASTEAKDIFSAVGTVPGTGGIWASTEKVDVFSAIGYTPIVARWASTEAKDIFSAIGVGATARRNRRVFFVC